ncbi:MAG: DUF3344 domain-containing protein, partial [Methanophagales archaeon]|nr:DUF3344 domain-containing protein [Methanophagales archaeon]
MNTKMKQISLPFVVVIAVLLAFSSPAAADYSGDHPLTTYEHGFVEDGGLIYETVTDGSGYFRLYALDPLTYSQDITINIPEGATVKTARLYNYYTWSGYSYYAPGDPAEAVLTLTDVATSDILTKTCVNPDPENPREINPIYYGTDAVQYWDSKGQGYASKSGDLPCGTFAWNVTDLVTGSGTYTATITNADSTPTEKEKFVTYGFGLLVVYEDADRTRNELEYWIDEGADYLYNTSEWDVYEPIATTNAMFSGCIEEGKVKKIYRNAELTTVVVSSDKGNAKKKGRESYNMNYFNSLSNEIGPSTAVSDKAIGLNYYDVLKLLQPCDNIAYFQDRDLGTGYGECEVVSNAFLVIEKK